MIRYAHDARQGNATSLPGQQMQIQTTKQIAEDTNLRHAANLTASDFLGVPQMNSDFSASKCCIFRFSFIILRRYGGTNIIYISNFFRNSTGIFVHASRGELHWCVAKTSNLGMLRGIAVRFCLTCATSLFSLFFIFLV
jgi:hypothetical protein